MARQKTDPDRVKMGALSATPMRDRGLDEQGRRYWRVRTTGDRRTLWAGWATRDQAEVIVADLLRKGIPARRDPQEGVRTVGDLLRRWVLHQEARLIEGAPKRATTITLGVLERACEAAGVPRFTSHGLRRLVATELLELADPRRVAELTGHSVAVLLRYYVRPRADDLREVVARSGIGQPSRKRGKVIPLGSRAQIPGTDNEE